MKALNKFRSITDRFDISQITNVIKPALRDPYGETSNKLVDEEYFLSKIDEELDPWFKSLTLINYLKTENMVEADTHQNHFEGLEAKCLLTMLNDSRVDLSLYKKTMDQPGHMRSQRTKNHVFNAYFLGDPTTFVRTLMESKKVDQLMKQTQQTQQIKFADLMLQDSRRTLWRFVDAEALFSIVKKETWTTMMARKQAKGIQSNQKLRSEERSLQILNIFWNDILKEKMVELQGHLLSQLFHEKRFFYPDPISTELSSFIVASQLENDKQMQAYKPQLQIVKVQDIEPLLLGYLLPRYYQSMFFESPDDFFVSPALKAVAAAEICLRLTNGVYKDLREVLELRASKISCLHLLAFIAYLGNLELFRQMLSLIPDSFASMKNFDKRFYTMFDSVPVDYFTAINHVRVTLKFKFFASPVWAAAIYGENEILDFMLMKLEASEAQTTQLKKQANSFKARLGN